MTNSLPEWNEARQHEIVRLLEENGNRLDAIDPAWPSERQRLERERLHAERVPLLEEAEQPLVHALASAGFEVNSAYDLLRRRCGEYDAAYPILLEHLDRTYPFLIRGGIARALSCRSAGPLWDELVERFRREPRDLPKRTVGASQGLAIAVSEACPDTRLPELLDFLRDRSLGPDRVLFIARLWRAKKGAYRDAILALSDDPDLAIEIEAKRKGKGPKS